MNKIWQRNFDDGVLVVATGGTQVASLAHVIDENGVTTRIRLLSAG